MAGFVQIIEFKTSRLNEIRDLAAQMQAQVGSGLALRGIMTADYERPGYYLHVVEFPSRQAAMENSARPETSDFAQRMAALCDEPPRFYNLDVVETWSNDTTASTVKKTVAETATAAAEIAAVGAGMVRQRLQQRRGEQGSHAASDTPPSAPPPPPPAPEVRDAEVVDRVVISPESDDGFGQRPGY